MDQQIFKISFSPSHPSGVTKPASLKLALLLQWLRWESHKGASIKAYLLLQGFSLELWIFRRPDFHKVRWRCVDPIFFNLTFFFPILKSHKLNFAIKFELQEAGQRSEDLWNPKTTTIKTMEIMGNGNLEMSINGCLHLKSKSQMWISRKPAMLPHPWVGTTK